MNSATLTVSVCRTWRPPVSAAPGAAGPPSLLSPPRTHASSPPAPCAEPPGSSSSARDVAEATGKKQTRGGCQRPGAKITITYSDFSSFVKNLV